jgi:hypothetical protein
MPKSIHLDESRPSAAKPPLFSNNTLNNLGTRSHMKNSERLFE